jgi:hypothetical protein
MELSTFMAKCSDSMFYKDLCQAAAGTCEGLTKIERLRYLKIRPTGDAAETIKDLDDI